MKFGLNKTLLAMLMPFLNMNLGIVEGDDGGSGDDGADDGDDSADLAAQAAQKAADDAAAAAKGNSTVTDAEAKLLKDVMAKKKALQESKDIVSKLTEQLKSFEGIDPTAVKALLAEKVQAEQKQMEAKGQWDTLKAQMAEAHKTELGGVTAKVADLAEKLSAKDSVISELTVGAAFSNSDFIKDELIMTPNKTRQVFGTHFGYEDGVIVGYDKPAGAKDRGILVDASGEPLSFEDAMRKIVDADSDRDHILKSKVKAGSGSKTAVSGKPKVVDTTAKSDVVGRERITGALADFLKGGK